MNTYIIVYPDELDHYGVKGMRWGVRKDRDSNNKRLKNVHKDKFSLRRFAHDHPYITIGASIAAIGLVAYGGTKLRNLNKQGFLKNPYTSQDIMRTLGTSQAKNLEVINDIPDLSKEVLNDLQHGKSVGDLSFANQLKVRKAIKDGYFTNCGCCTSAAALRRKGYDVVANKNPINSGYTIVERKKWWPGSELGWFRDGNSLKLDDRDGYIDHIEKVLTSQKKGAYGDISLRSSTNGHSIEYYVGSDGVKFYDYQIKKSYNSVRELFTSDYKEYSPSDTFFLRLDKARPDLDAMLKARIIKPRGK